MKKFFTCIALLLSTHCLNEIPQQTPDLPIKYKISRDFTNVEMLTIIQQAEMWNEIGEKNLGKKVFEFDGINPESFDPYKHLLDDEHTVWLNDSDNHYCGWVQWGFGDVVVEKNIQRTYWNIDKDLSESILFINTIRHEFGHLLGIGPVHIDQFAHGEQRYGIMLSRGNSTQLLEFSEYDKELLCLVQKCL